MGDYTGLRGSIVLNEKYSQVFDMMIECENAPHFKWDEILPADNVFLKDHRNSFIPFGDVCGIADWEYDVKYSRELHTLFFTCSLKNCNDTIHSFMDNVIPEIADSYDLEDLYEDDDQPTIWRGKCS